ncbi:MAG: DeoR/GlpR family DNA-binding transcription regulator [Treponema sp.]|jgi:DeoR/GlpR family transcriptional regulator of sugar metabolism|nr:DeoR/GlpR family DNA-binding transcription regulator [Treponema sp.]
MELVKDRHVKILDFLSSNKTVKISLLAELLNVSNVTLRKDLDDLEKRGIIRHTHGFASLEGADDTGKRMAFSHSIKRKIAKAAAGIIEEGETIMIESGSCCALFAEELALAKKNITIITNSVFIANYVCKYPNIKIILLGGCFQPESQVLVGPMTKTSVESFFPDKFFLGTDGFVNGQGFTGRDHLRVETALGLAKCAKQVFILTEAEKFKRRGAFSLIQLDKITGVFTDDSIAKEAEADLLKNKIQLHKVPVVEEKIMWRHYPGQPPFIFTEKAE